MAKDSLVLPPISSPTVTPRKSLETCPFPLKLRVVFFFLFKISFLRPKPKGKEGPLHLSG